MRKLLYVLFFFTNSFSQAQVTSSEKNVYIFPDSVWQYNKDPSLQGWDTKKLIELRNFIIDSSRTTGMMVIQHGKVIFDYGDIKELSYIASCRKSVLAMLYGPFVENGKIELNKPLEQLGINDVGGLLPIEKKATIKNLLTARSGVYHAASYSGDELSIAPNRGSVMPGSLFIYSNWDFNLAGEIFEKLTGIGIYDAVDSMLARPLKMQDWNKKIQHKEGDTSKSKYLAYPMWFSTRDMARIGYLMLRNGAWENKQIISTNWVQTITAPYTTFTEYAAYRKNNLQNQVWGYGYLWWPWDAPYNTGVYEGAYAARGAIGQFITVLPKLDLVVAHKTKAGYQRVTPENVYIKILDKLIAANHSNSIKKEIKYLQVKKEILNKYIGDYEHPAHPARIYKVTFENDTLRLTRNWDNYKVAILPISDTQFVSADGLYTSLHFTNIEKSNAKTLITTAQGSTISTKRISLLDESEINLSEFSGDYFSKELQTGYHLEFKDGRLYMINKGINYSSDITPVGQDLFMSRGQKIRFIRSNTSKIITGFNLETRSLKDMHFVKK